MVRFVVMASGKASRMGQDKLALPWGDTTILGHVLGAVITTMKRIDTLLASKGGEEPKCEVVVVARKPIGTFLTKKQIKAFLESSADDAIESEFQNNRFLEDENIDDGKLNDTLLNKRLCWIEVGNPQPLADTIRIGLSELKESIQGICFIPGDQIGINENLLTELTETFIKGKPDFLVPQAGHITGSPVFFHSRYKSELMALKGEQGGRAVLEKYQDLWLTHPVNEGFLIDVDTPEEYQNEISKRI